MFRHLLKSKIHRTSAEDLIIIAAFGMGADAQAASHRPRLVFVDAANCAVELRDMVAVQAVAT